MMVTFLRQAGTTELAKDRLKIEVNTTASCTAHAVIGQTRVGPPSVLGLPSLAFYLYTSIAWSVLLKAASEIALYQSLKSVRVIQHVTTSGGVCNILEKVWHDLFEIFSADEDSY